MTRQIRAGKGKKGLILANGGNATYQHVVCLSSKPRADGSAYPCIQPLPDLLTDLPVPKIEDVAEGEAVIEVSATTDSRNLMLISLRRTPWSSHVMASPSEGILWVA
jgi:hypothetical protein